MKPRPFTLTCCLFAVVTVAAWTLARGDDKENKNATETYTPTVEEWLQVYLNANFGRGDTQRFIGFIVMPGKKKVSMMTHIYQNHPRERQDPAHRQKLTMEADGFESQARKYVKRFGYELERQKP